MLPSHFHFRLAGDKIHKLTGLLGVSDEDQLYHRLVSQWKTPEEIVVGGHEPGTPLVDPVLRDGQANFTERMMYLDLVTYLPDDILVKVDRASMGVSLEARNPLLDHRVVEWIWHLPFRFKQRNGESKWLLRQVLSRYVPSQMIERPKMGFGVPVDAWLRGPLLDWAETLLDEGRLRSEGFFRAEPIRRVWAEHLKGHRNDSYRLWVILMFQAWKEEWSA